jgi:HK97 family phage portal protein
MGFLRRLFGLPEPQVKGLDLGSSYAESVVAGYPGGWPTFDSYGSLYRKQPAVRTVVDFLARNVAQLNPKIYMRVSDTDRQEWGDHPLAELLRNPNPTTTRYAFIRDTTADIGIYDRAYWRKIRGNRGLVRALVRVPPARLVVETDYETGRIVYRLKGEVIARDELVVFHGYHPDGGEMGVSPLETLRRVLAEEWAGQVHREWYWRNGSRTPIVIERPVEAPEWSPQAMERFKKGWEATTTGGTNAGKTGILEDGMRARPMDAFSPQDSQYIEGRKLHYDEVARVYAPALVGLLGADGQMANVESYHRQLYQDVLAPFCRMIQDEIDGQLLSMDEFDFGVPAYAEFPLREKLKGSFIEELEAITTAVGVPHVSINEARARQNLSRIDEDWADIPVQPMNVLYGGQPAVNVPVGGGVASIDQPARVAEFFDRYSKAIESRLGTVKALPIPEDVWQMERWVKDLAYIYSDTMPAQDAWKAAAVVLAEHRFRIAQAFSGGGLEAVRQVELALQ